MASQGLTECIRCIGLHATRYNTLSDSLCKQLKAAPADVAAAALKQMPAMIDAGWSI